MITKLLRDLYVDDATTSFNDVKSALTFYDQSKSCLSSASFNLRKWATNDKSLQIEIDKLEGIQSSNEIYRKVLGLAWNLQEDTFVFTLRDIASEARLLPNTKRNILKIAAMFFDPLGLISPVTLQLKLLFKQLCIEKYDWDTVISNDYFTQWTQILNELETLKKVEIKRTVLCCDNKVLELHGFCDSSGQAYCAVVYARVVCCHGISVKLWPGKCRLAPMKVLSIPRLELLSCLLLSNLITLVKNAIEYEVKVSKIFCWSDSQIAIWWIKQTSKLWKTWVV